MFNRLLVLFFVLVCLGGTACSEKTANNGAQPAPTFSAAPPEPDIVYAQGFYDEEKPAGGGGWRWMAPEGVVRLKNTGQDMVLVLAGSAPIQALKATPTIKVTLNGAPLDEFTGKAEGNERRYEIPAGKLGTGSHSELRINSDKSMVPQEVDPAYQDSRRLAFSLTKLTWQPK